MKLQKKLNVILVILIVLLVALVSFGGIYYQNKNQMINALPDYLLGADLTGYRKVTLTVKEDDSDSDEIEAQIVTDSETDESSENETSDENSTEEETAEENNQAANYRKSAQIIKGRLKSLKVENFTVACDEKTGKIDVTLPEKDQTDTILSDLVEIGEFTIKDSETDEVLLNNDDIRSVTITENAGTSYVQRVMTINLTTKGTSKYKNITKTYQNRVEENTTSNDTDEDTSSNELEGTEVNETSTDTSDDEDEEETAKQVTLNIDSSTLLTTTFTEVIDNGKISLTLSSSSSDASKEELYSTYNLAAIMENDALPVEYEIQGNTYIASDYSDEDIKILICAEALIAVIIAIVMIIKYKKQGLMQTILAIGYTSILLIIIRLTNVYLSMEGIIAIGISYIVNVVYGIMMAERLTSLKDLTDNEKDKIFKDVAKKYSLVIAPVVIIALICCFINWTSILSLGMILFWGILISWVYNILVNKFLLK